MTVINIANNPSSHLQTTSLDCPVCPTKNIQEGLLFCSNCGTDLTPIRRVRELVVVHFNKALAYIKDADLRGAITELNAALSIDSSFVSGRLLLGKVLWQLGHANDAVIQWQKILSLIPDNSEAIALLRAAESQKKVANVPLMSLGVIIIATIAFYASRMWHTEQPSIVSLPPPIAEQRTVSEPKKSFDNNTNTIPVAVEPTVEISAPQASTQAKQEVLPPFDFSELIDKLGQIDGLRTQAIPNGIRLIPIGDLFELGSDVPHQQGQLLLNAIKQALNSEGQSLTIHVMGITDTRPIRSGGKWLSNQQLGLFRASQSLHFLKGDENRHRYFAGYENIEGSSIDQNVETVAMQNRTVVIEINAN